MSLEDSAAATFGSAVINCMCGSTGSVAAGGDCQKVLGSIRARCWVVLLCCEMDWVAGPKRLVAHLHLPDGNSRPSISNTLNLMHGTACTAENLYNMRDTNLGRVSDDFYVRRRRHSTAPWPCLCALLALLLSPSPSISPMLSL
jgi:hypothetical protein